MERIRSLNRYQKGILLFMIVMVLAFAAIYSITIARVGLAYKGEILVPVQENGNTVYSGELQGKPISFTVFADKTVEFQYGAKRYGPYIAKEDPTAIPKESELREAMVGLELRCGEEILFRGGVFESGGHRLFYHEDGSMEGFLVVTSTNGVMMDENGAAIDPMEPSVSTILNLMDEPELSHKGNGWGWFGGVVLCLIAAVHILFAEELFRWALVFRVRNIDEVEPSDWEIACRYIDWTIWPIAALVVFVIGLR